LNKIDLENGSKFSDWQTNETSIKNLAFQDIGQKKVASG
jgi:hypothetical protein